MCIVERRSPHPFRGGSKSRQTVMEALCQYFMAQRPNEAFVLLRAEGEAERADDGVAERTVVGFLLIPGIISNGSKALFRYDLLPKTITWVGTAHSHMGNSNQPSSADLKTFAELGDVHMIFCEPFNLTCARAFDAQGNEMSIEII